MAVPLAIATLLFSGAGSADGSSSSTRGARRRPQPPVSEVRLEPGETVAAMLARGGLSGADARRILDLIRPHADWTAPPPEMVARFRAWPGELPRSVELVLDRDRTLVLELRGAVWQSSVDVVPVTRDTVVVTGRVETTLYASDLDGAGRLSTREKAELPGRLAAVFAWQIDFYRDPRPGDAFRIALERAIRPDGTVRETTVLAAEYERPDGALEAVRFSPSDESGAFYYDEAGRALRGAFLRAPLDLVRVTSRFAPARFHPVLGIYRSHTGVDYGAASGTPVRATGEGRVVHAGWAGDLGLMVELDHGRGIRTRYAHLSGIADRVAPGATVAQGEVIAAVGSTGLSTAPHLHYEFLQNGRASDPTSIDLPVERPIPDADAARFESERRGAMALLGLAGSPAPLAEAGRGAP